MKARLGFDVGGTFTDFVLVDPETGELDVYKQATTDDPATGVLEGLDAFLGEADLSLPDVRQYVHATTLATNTVLERDGADTALLLTEGFRDVPLLGRQKRYDLYDLELDKQAPIVPREDIYEVAERLHPRRGVIEALDEPAVRETARSLSDDYESVAISLLHAYQDPSHERRVAEIVESEAPDLAVSRSSDLSGLYREYERTNTAAIDAYVKPRMRGYLQQIEAELRSSGVDPEDSLALMQSSGGLATPARIRDAPVGMIESGPVAGSLNSAQLGAVLGFDDIFSFDMGGTTAKICFVVDGEPHRTDVFEVDELEMKRGSGLPITLSVVDMIEIGAGGGSIAAVEETGAIAVGPESAGADPGPICYGHGGTRPTVTDADLVLGYLNPEYFLGGAMALDEAAAAAGIERDVAAPLDVDVPTAAWGIKEVVDNSMTQASRIHAAERGIDLRSFAMIAFGGAGPMHAAFVARELGVDEIVVPTGAGVASAVGLLVADREVHLDQTEVLPIEAERLDRVNELFEALEAEGRDILAGETGDVDLDVERSADMKYAGQAHELTVDLPRGAFDESDLESLRARFHETYADAYGYSDEGDPIEGVTWKVTVRAPTDQPPIYTAGYEPPAAGDAFKGTREAYFDRSDGYTECDIYDRHRLDGDTTIAGPAVVEAPNSTTVIPPEDTATVDEYGNLRISVSG